jgi:hypothetical protein
MSLAEQWAACSHAAVPVNVDEVQISFDWEVPSRANEALTFLLDIKRDNRRSSVGFQIDLAKLAGADLERLHTFLATRPSGYRLTFEITWLLGLSCEQEMPASNLEVRQQRVRELLLCSENERTRPL